MDKKISKKKTVILTGASGGIGEKTAESLARKNMQIVLVGRNKTKLEQLVQRLKILGSESIACIGDLKDPEFLDSVVRHTLDRFGSLDILINNAGVAQHKNFEAVSVEEYDEIMTINTKAPFFLTQKALPFLLESEAGTVINISSAVAQKGYVQQCVYGASKSALVAWSRAFAAEYYKKNLRVHIISPGGVYTDMIALTRPELDPEEMMMPQDIADIIMFLLEYRKTNAVIDEINIHRANKTPFL